MELHLMAKTERKTEKWFIFLILFCCNAEFTNVIRDFEKGGPHAGLGGTSSRDVEDSGLRQLVL
jgi:hypothetical protein